MYADNRITFRFGNCNTASHPTFLIRDANENFQLLAGGYRYQTRSHSETFTQQHDYDHDTGLLAAVHKNVHLSGRRLFFVFRVERVSSLGDGSSGFGSLLSSPGECSCRF